MMTHQENIINMNMIMVTVVVTECSQTSIMFI